MTQTATETDPRSTVPRAVVGGVAGGLVLMAIFTGMWATWSFVGLPEAVGLPVMALFLLAAVVFVVEAIRLSLAARRLPDQVSPDAAPTRRENGPETRRPVNPGMWFGVSFAAEGVLIFVVCAILGNTGHTQFINPAIALIVGLHFIPLAKIFRRTLDYYVGAWVALTALAGIAAIATGALQMQLTWSLVSVAAAIGTGVYGFYMVAVGRSLTA